MLLRLPEELTGQLARLERQAVRWTESVSASLLAQRLQTLMAGLELRVALS